jgi:nitrogen regulatory protein P-II 2
MDSGSPGPESYIFVAGRPNSYQQVSSGSSGGPFGDSANFPGYPFAAEGCGYPEFCSFCLLRCGMHYAKGSPDIAGVCSNPPDVEGRPIGIGHDEVFVMKMILAIVRPDRLENIQAALEDIGVSGMMVTEGHGLGAQEGPTERYRGFEYSLRMPAKIRIEIAVSDDQADDIVEALRQAAYTGSVGDGKIFVYALQDSVRVRTGEIGEASL